MYVAVVLALLVTWLVGVRFGQVLNPSLRLSIKSRWLNNTSVVLRLEAENVSRANIEPVERNLVVSEHNEYEPLTDLVSPGVPDPRATLSVRTHRYAALPTTTGILPGERIVVERVHECPAGMMLHVLFQIRRRRPPEWFLAFRRRLEEWLYWPPLPLSWSTNAVVARERGWKERTVAGADDSPEEKGHGEAAQSGPAAPRGEADDDHASATPDAPEPALTASG